MKLLLSRMPFLLASRNPADGLKEMQDSLNAQFSDARNYPGAAPAYSDRRARIGSIFAARLAGNRVAAATAPMRTAPTMK